MSVNDPEPKIPRDDMGKGLRVLGVMLLAWMGFSMIWAPPHANKSLTTTVHLALFISSLTLIAVGYIVSWFGMNESEMAERTHDLMGTHGGAQVDGPLFPQNDGGGRPPTKVA